MSNWGTTSITITGPKADRAALHAVLATTATDKLAFSLTGAAPEIWRADGLVRIAEMTNTDDVLWLKVCMAYDGDCLPLAEALAQCHPTLRFEAWFDCEGSWPEFTVAVHEHGGEVCHAWFETTHLASLVIDPAEPRKQSAVVFYQSTPERELAAASCLGDCLILFLRRPELVAGWRKSDDDVTYAVYLNPDADEAGHLALAVDMIQGTASLLRNVSQYGGYAAVEQMSLHQARIRVPELAPDIDRALREIDADRLRQPACQTRDATAESAEPGQRELINEVWTGPCLVCDEPASHRCLEFRENGTINQYGGTDCTSCGFSLPDFPVEDGL